MFAHFLELHGSKFQTDRTMNSSTITDLLKKGMIALAISGGAAWVLWFAANLVR